MFFIVNGLDQIERLLKSAVKAPDFKELSNLLLATEQLLQQYQTCSHDTKDESSIETITYRLNSVKDRMGASVIETFETSIDSTGKLLVDDPTSLFGCCVAADVLESNLRYNCLSL